MNGRFVKTFEYIVKHDEITLNRMIDNYKSTVRDNEYKKIEIVSISNPVQTGETRYDINLKFPRFSVNVLFEEIVMTKEEIEALEDGKDIGYDLIVRNTLDRGLIVKIKGREYSLNNVFQTYEDRILYIEGMSYSDNYYIFEDISRLLKSKSIRKIKDWFIQSVYDVFYNGETLRLEVK